MHFGQVSPWSAPAISYSSRRNLSGPYPVSLAPYPRGSQLQMAIVATDFPGGCDNHAGLWWSASFMVRGCPAMTRLDVMVVGGGILGIAAARELLIRRPGISLAVLDKEASLGEHQTGHNSGVIHSGIYYAPGSLKSRLCTRGAHLIYEFCESHGVPADRCGKLIVATTEGELPALDELYRRGTANGVPGLEMVGPAGIREREPHCTGIRAIWSPATGIVDFSRVAEAMAGDVTRLGGEIRTGHLVAGLTVRAGAISVMTGRGEFTATRVLTCAGLQSDRVAMLSGAPEEPRIVPFRGDYWQLRPERRHLARNLIYPVPDPKFPFLGVHFTRRISDDAVWLGPNAVLALAREGYRRSALRPGDLTQTLRYPGFRRMARKYWRTGAAEVYRDRKSTRLNSSHVAISYAVFCLKKK